MDEQIKIEIDLAVNQAISKLKQLQTETAKTDSGFSKFQASVVTVSAAFNAVTAGVNVAIGAFNKLYGYIGSSIEAAVAQENAINELNTALKSAGITSQLVSQDLQNYANALQKTTTFSDDATLSAIALYVQLTKTSEGAKEAAVAAQNLSTLTGKDLNQSMLLLIKASEGGVEAFRRYGIEVKKGANDTETMKNAIDGVNAKLEGLAASKLNTFEGAIKASKNAWGELLETLGMAIIKNPVVLGTIQALTAAMIALNESMQSPAQKAAAQNQEELKKSIEETTTKLQGMRERLDMALADAPTRAEELTNKFRDVQDAAGSIRMGSGTNEDIAMLKLQIAEAETELKAFNERSVLYQQEANEQKKANVVKYYNDVALLDAAAELAFDDLDKRKADKEKLAGDLNFQNLAARKGEEAALDTIYKAQALEREGKHQEALLLMQTAFREQVKFVEDQAILDSQARHQYEIDSASNVFSQRMEMTRKFADFEKLTNKEKIQAQQDTINNLAAMQNSGNAQLRAIGKSAALVQIGLSTQQGAISAYAALAPIPFVGPFLGMAAAAALIAYGAERAANVAKYASGGVVPGVSYSGDNVTAAVNSGEMILNRQQQAELFNVANGGGQAAGTNISVFVSGDVVSDESFIDKVVKGINDGIELRNLQLKVA